MVVGCVVEFGATIAVRQQPWLARSLSISLVSLSISCVLLAATCNRILIRNFTAPMLIDDVMTRILGHSFV